LVDELLNRDRLTVHHFAWLAEMLGKNSSPIVLDGHGMSELIAGFRARAEEKLQAAILDPAGFARAKGRRSSVIYKEGDAHRRKMSDASAGRTYKRFKWEDDPFWDRVEQRVCETTEGVGDLWTIQRHLGYPRRNEVMQRMRDLTK
jgi:hypothetical protein